MALLLPARSFRCVSNKRVTWDALSASIKATLRDTSSTCVSSESINAARPTGELQWPSFTHVHDGTVVRLPVAHQDLACFGPPHRGEFASKRFLLRSFRPMPSSGTQPRAQDRHTEGFSVNREARPDPQVNR